MKKKIKKIKVFLLVTLICLSIFILFKFMNLTQNNNKINALVIDELMALPYIDIVENDIHFDKKGVTIYKKNICNN